MKEEAIKFLTWYRPELEDKDKEAIADKYIDQIPVVTGTNYPCIFPKCKKDPKRGCRLPDCQIEGVGDVVVKGDKKDVKETIKGIKIKETPIVVIEDPVIIDDPIKDPKIKDPKEKPAKN